MEILWSLCVLLVLFSVDEAHSHKGSQGLSCVNDVVSTVSCTWNGAPVAPGANCSITGARKTKLYIGNKKIPTEMIRTCKLEQHGNSPPDCSFVFENQMLNCFKGLPYIKMECDGTLVENITNYELCNHIKMNPPGAPTVYSNASDTWISWSAGSPVSFFIKEEVKFEVQIRQNGQTWQEAQLLFRQKSTLKIPSLQLNGHCHVRVRVYPIKWTNSHWSNWSPTTSWVVRNKGEAPQDKGWLLDETRLIMWGGIFIFVLFLIVMLIIYRSCVNKGLHKKKPVPNPSKYFHTLHSVHGGNLKKWLNPLSAPDSFFTAQPCDHISPVEFCEGSDVAPSTSPSSSSTCALLHFKCYPSAGSDTSGVADNSSSLSNFSNRGYFLSSSSGGSARTDPNPAYFTYKEDFHNQHNSHPLHLSLCPSITSCPTYESLKREPQSPDSGFGIGKEDEEDKGGFMVEGVEEEEVSDVHQTSPLLILPLHLPPHMCPPASTPPPPNAPSLIQESSGSQQVDTPVAAASGSYAAWPLASAMCRSTSMPVEPCKTGYLTLKELQTTFSNKSI
ncbi:interleukin-2 receptor subunit beta [Pagrus major]|uniref:interleukin-2 receptor subunit beta n=1 Tax=Pagrus major TaxID=143350 RepID=UPI003CC8E21D